MRNPFKKTMKPNPEVALIEKSFKLRLIPVEDFHSNRDWVTFKNGADFIEYASEFVTRIYEWEENSKWVAFFYIVDGLVHFIELPKMVEE